MEEDTGNTNKLSEYDYSYTTSEKGTFSVSRLRAKIAPYRFRLAARNITRELGLEGGEKVLELGSGLGLLGREIGNEVDGKIDYFGVELAFNPASRSKDMITLPIQADALELPFPKDSFDAVVSTDVLEHIPDNLRVIQEIYRVLKPGKKAFIVIADPSEGRFYKVHDHIDRRKTGSDVKYWEEMFVKKGFKLDSPSSEKYRERDWRKIFNLPFLVRYKELKDKPGFACAFNPTNRPGVYIIEKPAVSI